MRPRPSESELDASRRLLARAGVPLFAPTPAAVEPPRSADALAAALVALTRSGDARLLGSVPCLLVAAPRDIVAEAVRSAALAHPADAPGFFRVYRLSRALEASRRPDLTRLFAPASPLPSMPEEPDDLPEPSELHGEMTLWVAAEQERDRGGERGVIGGIVRLFDTWIRLRGDELAGARA